MSTERTSPRRRPHRFTCFTPRGDHGHEVTSGKPDDRQTRSPRGHSIARRATSSHGSPFRHADGLERFCTAKLALLKFSEVSAALEFRSTKPIDLADFARRPRTPITGRHFSGGYHTGDVGGNAYLRSDVSDPTIGSYSERRRPISPNKTPYEETRQLRPSNGSVFQIESLE